MGQYTTSYVPMQSDYDGNLCGRGTQDGHGGRAEQHRAEMEQIAERIAEQKIAAIVPQIQAEALQQARDDLLRAFSFDVETIVSIAFHNGETIWRDSRTQRAVAESIMREIRKRLDRFSI